MGKGAYEKDNDFSDTLRHEVDDFILDNNLIWNNGNKIPSSFFDAINPSDDKNLLSINPNTPNNQNLVTPVWNSQKLKFNDGSLTIYQTFKRVISLYGTSNFSQNKTKQEIKFPVHFSDHNIMGVKRQSTNEIGAN